MDAKHCVRARHEQSSEHRKKELILACSSQKKAMKWRWWYYSSTSRDFERYKGLSCALELYTFDSSPRLTPFGWEWEGKTGWKPRGWLAIFTDWRHGHPLIGYTIKADRKIFASEVPVKTPQKATRLDFWCVPANKASEGSKINMNVAKPLPAGVRIDWPTWKYESFPNKIW